ncbi:hypothetical protein GCM10010123_24660 [Pilimelia anulata]|uniref:Uncharacterized protein n=1 Tax=Pilimelia anulata TaxID=53371 RepID=A0A8J3BC94_9ACTN|nr:hypothetical protein [Pilimelia anulata]GGJ93860.1 hypothetical protein GCM10010123_24660 [Pilimelia anulata]
MIRRHWMRARPSCPSWCPQDHRCTARHGYPSGEHRSAPIIWHTGYGAIHVAAVAPLTGTPRIEMTTVLRLDPDRYTDHARALVPSVDRAVRAVLSAALPGRETT